MNRSLVIAICILLLFQGLIATAQISALTSRIVDPLVILETKIANPKVKFGDNLIVTHRYMRRAYCKVDIDRFIIRLPDEMLVRRERLPAGTTLLGDSTRNIAIPTKFPSQAVIPFGIADVGVQDLFPGTTYRLREFLHSDCGDHLHTAVAPDVTFEVIE